MARVTLHWFALTTVVFWLPAVRGAFDGRSYAWGLLGLGGRGMQGDYWFPLLGAAGALAVIVGGWRGRFWAFVAAAAWSALLFVALTAGALSDPEALRFRGETLGIDISLAVAGPLLFGAGTVLAIFSAVRVRRRPAERPVRGGTRRLAVLAALCPVQFALFRSGAPGSLADQIGVLLTIAQWLLIGWAVRADTEPRAGA